MKTKLKKINPNKTIIDFKTKLKIKNSKPK